MVPVALVSGLRFTAGTPLDWLWTGLMAVAVVAGRAVRVEAVAAVAA
jgi:hypothetical protein